MDKKHKSLFKKTTFFGALFTGAILASYLIVNWPIIAQQVQFISNTLPTSRSIPESDSIQIPNISVNAPIVWSETDNKETMQNQLLEGVVHYTDTAFPGEIGNGVYIGHSSNYWWQKSDYNTIFGLLEKLEPGDEIVLNYNDDTYKYQVTGKKTIAKDNPEIFTDSSVSEITLVTCWPSGTNLKNFFVRTKLIE